MILKARSVITCIALFLSLLTLADGAQADVGSLPTVLPDHEPQAGQMAGTTNWALGDVNTLYGITKVSPSHSLPAVLTLSWVGSIVHGEGSTPLHTSSMVLFGNGASRTRSDVNWIWEVGRATPSLYLVLALTEMKMVGPESVTVFAINTYRFTVKDVLHSEGINEASLQCGLVFLVDGQHYTVRGPRYSRGGATDLTHALIRGVNTCK